MRGMRSEGGGGGASEGLEGSPIKEQNRAMPCEALDLLPPRWQPMARAGALGHSCVKLGTSDCAMDVACFLNIRHDRIQNDVYKSLYTERRVR